MTKNEIKKIVDEALIHIDKIEAATIQMMGEQYNDGAISDEDLYFLSEMIKLTRTYGDLVYKLPDVLKEDDKEG